MLWFIDNDQLRRLCVFLPAIAVSWLSSVTSARAQIVASGTVSPRQANTKSVEDELLKRRMLALDTAVVAARAKLFDLSIEAAQRVTQQGLVPAKPTFESSLLRGQTASSSMRIISFNEQRPVDNRAVVMQQKLKFLIGVWKEGEAPPHKVAQLLQAMVLPTAGPILDWQLSSEEQSGRSYSFDFAVAAKPAPTPWSVNFELVHWSDAAGQLDELIRELELRLSQPASQTLAISLLIYAERVAGRAEAILKRFDDFAAGQPNLSRQGQWIVHALKSPITNKDKVVDVEPAAIDDRVLRVAELDPANAQLRPFVMEMLPRVVEHRNSGKLDELVTIFEKMIEQQYSNSQSAQMSQQLERQITQQKTFFFSSVERECRRLGKVGLATEMVLRIPRGNSETGLQTTIDLSTRLVDFAKGTANERFNRSRRLLLSAPLESMEQFAFGRTRQLDLPPVFFAARDGYDDVLPHLEAYPKSGTCSLLDLLLNSATELGEKQEQETVSELFAKAGQREDVTKLVARWLIFRAEKRGQQPPDKLVQLGAFTSDEEFIDWWKRAPVAVANQLLAQRIEREQLSEPWMEIIRRPANARLSQQFSSVDGLIEAVHKAQSPAQPPVRSVSDLKHWCLARARQRNGDQSERMVWTLTGSPGQMFRYQSGTLMLRYPLAGDFTVRGDFALSQVHSPNIGLNGLFMGILAQPSDAYVTWSQAPDRRANVSSTRAPMVDSNVIEWTVKGDTLSVSLNAQPQRSWRQHARAYPFLSLSAAYWNGLLPDDLVIEGDIKIPRQLDLIDEMLTGWSALDIRHTLPPNQDAFEQIRSVGADENSSYGSASTQAIQPVWRVHDGEIVVGQTTKTAPDKTFSAVNAAFGDDSGLHKRHSVIIYQRPLLEGEQIEFEFFHDAQGQTVAPMIGRMAYILSADKVSLHWVATETELKRLNLPEDNRAEDPAAEQLAPAKLRDGDWNRLAIRLQSGAIVLSLEGKDIYRRPLGKNEPTLFGFFADPTASPTRIRRIVLKGDWPSQLPTNLWELLQ